MKTSLDYMSHRLAQQYYLSSTFQLLIATLRNSGHQLRAVVDADLVEDVCEVFLDGGWRRAKGPGDVPVAIAEEDEFHDLRLALRQAVPDAECGHRRAEFPYAD